MAAFGFTVPEATKPTVLLVDDSPDILRMATIFLEKSGLHVIASPSPFGVSKLVRKHKPRVVVLDVMMPALSGDALAKVLGSLPGPPAVVFYSAVDPHVAEDIRRKAPSALFVSKTDGLKALLATIQAALEATAV